MNFQTQLLVLVFNSSCGRPMLRSDWTESARRSEWYVVAGATMVQRKVLEAWKNLANLLGNEFGVWVSA